MRFLRVSIAYFSALIALSIFGSAGSARAAILVDTRGSAVTSTPVAFAPYAHFSVGQSAISVATGTTLYFRYYSGQSASPGCSSGGEVFIGGPTSSTVDFSQYLTFTMTIVQTSPGVLSEATGSFNTIVGVNSGEYLFIEQGGDATHQCIVGTGGTGSSFSAAPNYLYQEAPAWACLADDPTSCYGAFGGAPTSSIAFISPVDGTTTPPFFYWTLLEENIPTSTLITIVTYGHSTSTLNFNDPHDDGAINTPATSTQLVPSNLPALPAPTSSWYAQAGIFYPGSSTPLAISTIINFTIDNSLSPTQSPGGTPRPVTTLPRGDACAFTASSASSSLLTQFFDPLDLRDTFKTAICESYIFLFIPTDDENANIAAQYNFMTSRISKKPPFGYYTSVGSAFSDLQNPTGTPTSSIMSASSSAILAFIITPLDEGVAAFIGFLFLVWLFHRARLFEPT